MILPSISMPCFSLPTGIRGLGGGLSSPGGGPWRPCGEAAKSRPPSRPSESARGAMSRQVARTPEGTVATQRRPSECGRAKRQHSRYSEMLRGMISRACERVRRRSGPCLLSAGGSRCHCVGAAGREAQRRAGAEGPSSRPRHAPAWRRTLSESERAHGGKKLCLRPSSLRLLLVSLLRGEGGSRNRCRPRPGGVVVTARRPPSKAHPTSPTGSERCPSEEARSGGSSRSLLRNRMSGIDVQLSPNGPRLPPMHRLGGMAAAATHGPTPLHTA
mmetsp:Transcript_125456/g.366449  ORF Transcript_125456/g.366449 Transcript_125456/m.366449 type:complete len:273 (-) Transcript_125456:22-840(-)